MATRLRKGEDVWLAEQVFLPATKAPHVLSRHVDTAAPGVLADVLEMLDELQGDANLVGKSDPLRCRDAEHRQHEPAHRRGGQHAVLDEVPEAFVTGDTLVHPVRLDEGPKRLQAQVEALDQRVS